MPRCPRRGSHWWSEFVPFLTHLGRFWGAGGGDQTHPAMDPSEAQEEENCPSEKRTGKGKEGARAGAGRLD